MSTCELITGDARRMEDYLRRHAVKKLQIGSGLNLLDGWLNTDLHSSEDKIGVDATRAFPFDDEIFDYIFSEHMIEHITYEDGVWMLSECFRVLRPGGEVRIATPDLSFLIALHRADRSPLQEEYIRWSIDTFLPDVPAYEAAFVINNFVRAWDHTFIYDERVLRHAMEAIGFVDVRRHALGESDDEHLRGLEHQSRLPPGFLHLETMVLEATRPDGPGGRAPRSVDIPRG
jgi:predicted SAM-dependent methyltransferase